MDQNQASAVKIVLPPPFPVNGWELQQAAMRAGMRLCWSAQHQLILLCPQKSAQPVR